MMAILDSLFTDVHYLRPVAAPAVGLMGLVEIEPELFLVLFRPGTTSVRSGLGTFFVLEPEHAKHFLCS